MEIEKIKIKKGKRYIVYIDTCDPKKINFIMDSIKKELGFKWWKPFETRFISVPMHVVKIKEL